MGSEVGGGVGRTLRDLLLTVQVETRFLNSYSCTFLNSFLSSICAMNAKESCLFIVPALMNGHGSPIWNVFSFGSLFLLPRYPPCHQATTSCFPEIGLPTCMNDLTFHGHITAVLPAASFLHPALSSMGLDTNMKKCLLSQLLNHIFLLALSKVMGLLSRKASVNWEYRWVPLLSFITSLIGMQRKSFI